MEKRSHAILLSFPGTNCERETARALETVGFTTECIPFGKFTAEDLQDAGLLVFSGGFSYGDYIMSGRLAVLELEHRAGEAIRQFHADGGYLLGICNGFQILSRLGLLPKGSLIDNTQRRFICRWAQLENRRPDNVFLNQLPNTFELPVAHAEGRFVSDTIPAEGIALTYGEVVNGSMQQIAGLQDETGRVFGLMPHPERFLYREHHYDKEWSGDPSWGWGYYFFKGIFDALA